MSIMGAFFRTTGDKVAAKWIAVPTGEVAADGLPMYRYEYRTIPDGGRQWVGVVCRKRGESVIATGKRIRHLVNSGQAERTATPEADRG